MSAIFMNSEFSKTTDAHKLRLNIRKTDLRRSEEGVTLSDLSI